MAGAPRSPALSWLWGARVQRVDGPSPGCLSLTLFRSGDKRVLLLAFGAEPRGVGCVRARPQGEAASAYTRRLRTQIEGARLSAAYWLPRVADGDSSPRASSPMPPPAADASQEPLAEAAASAEPLEVPALALLLVFRRAEHEARIVADFASRAPNLFLLRADDTIAGAADERARRERFAERDQHYLPGAGRGIVAPASERALWAAGETLLSERSRHSEDATRAQAKARVRSALKRLDRKIAAIGGDIARAASAPALRREAQLLLRHLGAIPRGAQSARLLDDSVEPPSWAEVSLDPARDVRELVEQRFERARKLERGVAIASARLSEAETQAARMRTLLEQVASAPVAQLRELVARAGLELEGTAAKRHSPPARVPYRVFVTEAGERILVGKGATDNDALTLTIARPHDHWLHVRGSSGSHVVVPLERTAAIGQELLLAAAHLAVHFSKLRGEPMVEVAHTARRFVRKSRGAAPGSVTLDRERVFVLRLDRERLARLLASERS